jgi:hypothetical protein
MAINSYTSNQWYNYPTGVTGPGNHKSLARTNKDNPEFMFPGNPRKNLGIGGQDTKIQRGFMRCLLTEIDGAPKDLPNRRFFFQFNPERIMRSVSLSSGMTNVLFQDPGQFSVATPGNATFSFDIMLNREMEVNNHTNFSGKRTTDVPPPLNLNDLNNIVGNGIGTPTGQDVGQIGVLADLMIMDSIIGQGISDDIISALSKLTSRSSTWDSSDSSSGASAGTDPNFISETDASNAFKAIRGNSAFLVSTPVRIVFSSMFMVDGFIQASSVNFTKFNNSMVPTMCVINVQVEAKYIGFAKKDTYLTQSLNELRPAPTSADAGAGAPKNIVGDPEEYALLLKAISDSSNYQIHVAGINDNSAGWTPGNVDGPVPGNYRIMDLLSFDNLLLRMGFVDSDEDTTKKGLGKLFYDSNYKLTVKHTPRVRVWRSFSGNEQDEEKINGRTATFGDKGPGTLEKSFQNWLIRAVVRNVLLLDVEGTPVVINDLAGWKKYRSYGGGNSDFGDVKTVDKNYDNKENRVFSKASDNGVSKSVAKSLFFQGVNADNADDIVLLVEYSLDIEATIQRSDGKNSTVFLPFTKKVFQKRKSMIYADMKMQIYGSQTTTTGGGGGGSF